MMKNVGELSQKYIGTRNFRVILGDPGADRGGKGKSKQAKKKMATKKSVVGREEPLGTSSYRTSSKQQG